MGDEHCSFQERISEMYAEIDNDLVMGLAEDDPRYRELKGQIMQIRRAHPALARLMGSKGPVELSEEEHEKLKELYQLNMRVEDIEREKLYFQGHADAIRYLMVTGLLKAE